MVIRCLGKRGMQSSKEIVIFSFTRLNRNEGATAFILKIFVFHFFQKLDQRCILTCVKGRTVLTAYLVVVLHFPKEKNVDLIKRKSSNKMSVDKVKMPFCWLRLVWITLSGHFSLCKTTMGV